MPGLARPDYEFRVRLFNPSAEAALALIYFRFGSINQPHLPKYRAALTIK